MPRTRRIGSKIETDVIYAKAKSCVVLKKLPDLEMVFIDIADLLRRYGILMVAPMVL
jgi:hypothetical protein